MNTLGKPQQHGTVFVAGEYWEGGTDLQFLAQEQGCGVLFENGGDLTVVPAGVVV